MGLNDTVVIQSAAAAVVTGTPLVYAGLGELLSQRSGVMNLGVDGMMLMGAVAGIMGTFATGSPWVGVLTGALAGAALAAVHAGLCIGLRVNQVVSGLALLFLGAGLSSYLGKVPDPPLTERAAVPTFPDLLDPLADLPVVGPVLFGQDAMVHVSWLVVALAGWYLARTRPGLSTRAVGEDPATADAAGLPVDRIRTLHVLLGGALAGVGGAYTAIAITGIWQSGITAGSGWIAFALVSFAGWRPGLALAGAYAFGALTGLSFTMQIAGVDVSGQLLAMVPFLATFVVLVAISASPTMRRRLAPPAALGLPYERESR